MVTVLEAKRRLLNDWQRDFPLEPRPYARIAAELGLAEQDVIQLLRGFCTEGVLARVGAVVRPNAIGASTLAAARVHQDRLQEAAAAVSRHREVNHCYEREHAYNLWFVVTAGDRADVLRVLEEISEEIGAPVIDLPILDAFHIDLGFDLQCG